MSHFAEYMETRRLTPLYEQAAGLISLDVPFAIHYCESRSVNRNRNLGKIYEMLARELRRFSEVDYGAAFAANAAQQKADREAAAARERDAAAARAAEQDKLEKARQAAAEKVKADAAAAAGRTYSAAPMDLVAMLKHIGVNLQSLHKAGYTSHDYAQAIQAMVMDLQTAVRRFNDPKEPAERAKLQADRRGEAAKRQAAASAEFEKKSAAAKEVADMMEIVKTLRAAGLPAEVSDHDAATIYKQLYGMLEGVHKAGHSPRKALEWWLKHDEFGDDHATDEQRFVMAAVLKLGDTHTHMPTPGHHKHIEPDPEPEDVHHDDTEDLGDDDEPSPLPPIDDEDEDLMAGKKGGDEDEDFGDDAGHEPASTPKPKPSKKSNKMFDLKKLAGLSIPAGEENNALQIAVKAAIADPTIIEPIKEPLGKVLNYLTHRFNKMKGESPSGMLNKSNVTRMINKFFNGESDNPNMPILIEKIRKGMEGVHYEELKKVIVHVMHKMHTEKSPTNDTGYDQAEPGNYPDWYVPKGMSLQEQQQYSIMLRTLAGIRK